MSCSLIVISCNSGTSVNTTTSALPQVQLILPIDGDTNVGISSPIIVEFKSSVESTEISASLIDLNSNTAYNLTLAANASKTIYTYTPLSALNPNSTYHFVLFQNNNQNSVNASVSSNNSQSSYSNPLISSTYTTQTAYKIL